MSAGHFLQRLTEHLLLSGIPALLGGALAWPASKYAVRQVARMRGPDGSRSPWVVLFPWRAILVTLIILFVPFVPFNYVLGPGLAFYLTGMTLASFVLGVVLLTHAHFSEADLQNSADKMVASIRTLAVAVVGVAVPGYDDLGLGAGSMIWAGIVRLGLDTMWAGIGVVALLALMFDLVIGYFQYRTFIGHESSAMDGVP